MNIVSYYAGDCILKILFSSYRNLLIIQSVHHITFILCYTVYGFFMDYLVGSMSYISFCVTNFLFEKFNGASEVIEQCYLASLA